MPKPQGAVLVKSGHYGLYLTLALRRGASLAPYGALGWTAGFDRNGRARTRREAAAERAVAIGARAWPLVFRNAEARRLWRPSVRSRMGRAMRRRRRATSSSISIRSTPTPISSSRAA